MPTLPGKNKESRQFHHARRLWKRGGSHCTLPSVSMLSAIHSCRYTPNMPITCAQDCVPHENTAAAGCSILQKGVRSPLDSSRQRFCSGISSFLSLLTFSQKVAIIASLQACLGGIQPFFKAVLLCWILWCLPQKHSPWEQNAHFIREGESVKAGAEYTCLASKKKKCRKGVGILNPFSSSQPDLEHLTLQISAKTTVSSRSSCPEAQRSSSCAPMAWP